MGNKNETQRIVLIVEDEVPLREAIAEKFKAAGFAVHEASNGEEGLEKAHSIHPDLIILDIIMPKMDGIAMLKELKRDVWGINVPTIVLTNVSDYYKLEEALTIGVDEYLIKADWKLKDIVSKANAILGL